MIPTEDDEVSEDQPLRTLSQEAADEDVDEFAARYGLLDKLGVFRKASALLRNGGDYERIPGLSTTEIEALEQESTNKWSQPTLLYFTILVCSLGAIEQGWAQTALNGANLYIPEALDIDSKTNHGSFVLGLINCGLFLSSGLLGTWLSEPINNRFGRRGTIFVAHILCLAGNLGSSISWSWPVLLFFRFVLGGGIGLNASTVSIFAAESAPSYIRGGLSVSWQLFTAFGIFLGFLANVAFYNTSRNLIWRFQLAAPLIPSLPLLLCIYVCPESASWHVKRLRYDLAYDSLSRLRRTELQAAFELYSIRLSQDSSAKVSDRLEQSYASKVKALFSVARNLHALMASYVVMISQQLCGINIIAFYSSTIFSSSGFTPLAALWASVIFGFVNFIGAFPAIWTMDTFGRRRLLLWTLPIMGVILAVAALSFSLPKGNLQFISLACLIYVFCGLYSPGMGPVPVAYSAEVYPLSVREVGMSFAISTANLWATVLSLTFPGLLNRLGEQGSFGLYAVLNGVAWLLCYLFVRETKGVRLEEMDDVFECSPSEFAKRRWDESMAKLRGRQRHEWLPVQQEDAED